MHTKLLVAFVGTVLLVVVLGLLGLRLLGQSNERVETLGTLQERAFAYGKLQSDALHVRLLQAENVGGDYFTVFPDLNEEELAAAGPGRRPVHRERRRADPGIDLPGQPRLPASARGRGAPPEDPGDGRGSSRT